MTEKELMLLGRLYIANDKELKGDNAKASQLQKLASAKQKLDDALENKKQLQKEEKELIEKKKALGLSQTL